jgi:hypothetical protein
VAGNSLDQSSPMAVCGQGSPSYLRPPGFSGCGFSFLQGMAGRSRLTPSREVGSRVRRLGQVDLPSLRQKPCRQLSSKSFELQDGLR